MTQQITQTHDHKLIQAPQLALFYHWTKAKETGQKRGK